MFTYDVVHAEARDRIRFALGDTDSTEPMLQDETIEAVLEQYGNDEDRTIAHLAGGLVSRYSRMPDTIRKDDGTEVRWKDRLTAWRSLAGQTTAATASGGGMMTRRATRYDTGGAEYYAGGRGSLDCDY
jgi:hypothetical protein